MTGSSARPIGLVVEGDSEYHALPVLLAKLQVRHATPANFHGQSDTMTPKQLVHRALPCVQAQARKRVSRIIVVLDRESREECAPDFASNVQDVLIRRLTADNARPACPIVVVCADRKIENWLFADPAGLAKSELVRRATSKRRAPANVDGTDGEADLKALMFPHHPYRSGTMTGELAKHIRVECSKVQQRSRSLRKFVKEVKTA